MYFTLLLQFSIVKIIKKICAKNLKSKLLCASVFIYYKINIIYDNIIILLFKSLINYFLFVVLLHLKNGSILALIFSLL